MADLTVGRTGDFGWVNNGRPNMAGAQLNKTGSHLREFLEGSTIIDPKETPAWSFFPKQDVSSIEYWWLTDAYDAPVATSSGAKPEGSDFLVAGSTPKQRVFFRNNTEIRWKILEISRSMQTVSKKGGVVDNNDEYSYQLAKKFVEIGRDLSAAMVVPTSADYVLSSGTSGNTRITAKLQFWAVCAAAPAVNNAGAIAAGDIVLLTCAAGGTATKVYDNKSTTVATFNVDNHMKLRRNMESYGANVDTMWVGTGTKMDISSLVFGWGKADITVASTTGGGVGAAMRDRYRINIDRSNRILGGVVDIIEDDLGQIYLVRDRWMPANAAGATAATTAQGATATAAGYFLFDRSKVFFTILDDIQHKPLPPTADADRGAIIVEYGTKCLHPNAVGMMVNCAN